MTSQHVDLSLLVVVLFYIYTWTLGYKKKELKEGLMEMNKVILFKGKKKKIILLIVSSHSTL